MSDEDIHTDEESELPHMSPSQPSFASVGSQRSKHAYNRYETPIKSRASTSATPDLQPKGPAFSLPLGAYSRRSSPSWDKALSVNSSPLGKQQYSERFLKLQADLHKRGYSTGLEHPGTSFLPQSLRSSPSPPRQAIRLEADEDALSVLRPQLRWCPFCRREVTTSLLPHPSRKT
jgi:hypothetical protein